MKLPIHIGAKFARLRYPRKLYKIRNKFKQKETQVFRHLEKMQERGVFESVVDRDYVETADGKRITTATIKNMMIKEGVFDDCPIKGFADELRGIVQFALRNYSSYLNRNNKDATGLSNTNRTLSIIAPKCTVDTKKKIIFLRTLFGDCEVRYNISFNADKVKKSKFGGNIMFNQGVFVVLCKEDLPLGYKPKGSIGIDINKEQKYWVAFSDGTYISRPHHILEMEEELRILNKLISDDIGTPNTSGKRPQDRVQTSRQRSKTRKRINKLHAMLQREVSQILEPHMDRFIKEELLICIDSVSIGAQTGTFGQDKIKTYCTKRCQQAFAPHYVVPTPYTSQRCDACGCVHEDSRPKVNNIFQCVSCGAKANDQIHAAQNIQFVGEYFQSKQYDYKNHPCTSAAYIDLRENVYYPNAPSGSKAYATLHEKHLKLLKNQEKRATKNKLKEQEKADKLALKKSK